MAEFKFFNYADAVKDAETVIGQRQKNAINAFKLEDAQNTFDKRMKRDQILAQHADTPARIKALNDQGMVAEAMELRKSYIDIQQSGIDLLESQAKGWTEETWDANRAQQIAEGARPESIPEKYDPTFMNDTMKAEKLKVANVNRIFTAPDGTIMGQSITRKGGEIIEGEPYDYAKASRAKSGSNRVGSLTPSDSNSIRAAIAVAMNTKFKTMPDGTIQYIGLDPDQAAKAARAGARAADLFTSGQNPTHDGAAAAALSAEGDTNLNVDDVLGLR